MFDQNASRSSALEPGERSRRKRVLITGAAGRIGQAIRPVLRERFDLRLLIRNKPLTPEVPSEEVMRIPIDGPGALKALAAAMQGIDAVVHLAANPSSAASWESTLNANIVGAYNIFEAARLAGVGRIVFASTNHVTGMYERDGLYCQHQLPVRPDSLYGVSKVFGEALGRFYHDQHGLAVICLRIGSFQPRPRNARMLTTWLSPRDCAQLCRLSIETDKTFGIYYGISDNRRAYWDITNAVTELGYRPEDNAEEFAAEFSGQ